MNNEDGVAVGRHDERRHLNNFPPSLLLFKKKFHFLAKSHRVGTKKSKKKPGPSDGDRKNEKKFFFPWKEMVQKRNAMASGARAGSQVSAQRRFRRTNRTPTVASPLVELRDLTNFEINIWT